MTEAKRPKEGSTPAIEDTYAYNGDGLRTSQTSESATTYLAWNLAESLPLLLNDGTNSYVYGPEGLPVEQISSGGTTLYLHHDQQGSTRLLTSSTGTKEASFSYDAYGNQIARAGTATTPLGYDAQYANSDTGLIYLRAREYDPATAQFMSVDPRVMESGEVYGYASDNPISLGDPTGECPIASAAAILGPHPPLATPEECEKQLSAVRRIASKVKQRIKDLAKDEHELPPAEIDTHIKSLNEASRALEKVISAFKSRGCQETLSVQIPSEVVQLAELRWRVELRPRA